MTRLSRRRVLAGLGAAVPLATGLVGCGAKGSGSSNTAGDNARVRLPTYKAVVPAKPDYPGTESETIPLNTQPGSTNPLTCPEGAQYYHWGGAQTSAQYYVNNAGVAVEDACQWDTAGTNIGNWAPVNLGVGYSGGTAWLAILANKPYLPAT